MDRVISKQEQAKAKRKTYLKVFGGLFVISVLLYGINEMLTKTISRKDILIGVVERGEVSLEISAQGRIEPVHQIALTAPFSTILESVYHAMGDQVAVTTALLSVDRTVEEGKLRQMEDEAELKRSALRKEKLRLEKELFDLENEASVTALDIQNLKAAVSSEEKLLAIGGTTEEALQKARTALEKARLRNQKIQNELAYKKLSIQEELKRLSLNLNIAQEHIEAQKRKLEKAEMRATMKGVITFIHDKVGSAVQAGEVLARIANLDNYRIRGQVAEEFSNQVAIGMKARIESTQHTFEGVVSSVAPSSNKGMVSIYLSIQAEQEVLQTLRPDMVVDIALKKEQHTNTLRIPNKGAFQSKKVEEVFLLEGNKAERVTVRTGYRNVDWVEIISGLQEGDTIIVSNTSRFINSPIINLED
ncbi:efflux RND transporter periplasmic adaptor subunit [Algivirga pacifica]|uniref:Efflux RND transporter periplasmic adaptor subunit n=1 Tax=Algivirga pacifica TaxID=1162670 RepID=A0ABP9DPI2_9BACT